jgi:hypothetical protein
MEVSIFWIPITAIIGAFLYIIIKTMTSARVRELEIRERIAMIERGLVPAPEADPRGFDNVMQRLEQRDRRYGTGRHRRAGVTMIGVGVGLMVLIGFAGGEPNSAIGIGGFLVVIGIAFFINGLLDPPERTAVEPPGPFPGTPGAPGVTGAHGVWTGAPPPAKPSEPPRHD